MTRTTLLRFTLCVAVFLLTQPAQAQTLNWAKQVSGPTDASTIICDAAGNTYALGRFSNTADLDPGSGTFNLTAAPMWTYAYILKLDANGNFVWAKALGGNTTGFGMVNANDIVLDDTGNIYVTGLFDNTVDFDPSSSTYDITSSGSNDIYILKLDSAGNFGWARGIGGPGDDRGRHIAIDEQGNLYTSGTFNGLVDFDPFGGTDNQLANGLTDVFLLKLDAGGSHIWSAVEGVVSSHDEAGPVIVKTTGDIYWQTVINDAGTLHKRDAGGGAILTMPFAGKDITRDNMDNLYVTGKFSGTVDFDLSGNTFNLTAIANDDIFVLKLDNTDNLVWVKQMGGWNYEEGMSIAVGSDGSVYVSGMFKGVTDFDPGAGTSYMSAPDTANTDVFYLKLNSSGSLVWVHQLGNANAEYYNSLAIDGMNNIFLTGSFKGTVDFDPGAGIANLTTAGNYEGYMMKLGTTLSVKHISSNENEVNIYPNPATREFYISSDAIINSVIINDALGRVVYSSSPVERMHYVKLDVVPGIYYVRVNDVVKVMVCY